MTTEKKTKGKSPGFWFFTGDWLKDPELRFCSIFARGLLVDLLCYMFEAKKQGYLSWDDGTARTDEEIADAVSGGDREEKIAAIQELERKGVLSRDKDGVLFSRRMARLGEISKSRQQAGSKGGSKKQAKVKQIGEQKPGVSVSDSVSDSDNNISISLLGGVERNQVDAKLLPHWERWCNWIEVTSDRPLDAIRGQAIFMELLRRGTDKAIQDIDFSIQKGAKSILDSDADFEKARKGTRGKAAEPTGGSAAKPPKLISDSDRVAMENLYAVACRTGIDAALEQKCRGSNRPESTRQFLTRAMHNLESLSVEDRCRLVPEYKQFIEKQVAK